MINCRLSTLFLNFFKIYDSLGKSFIPLNLHGLRCVAPCIPTLLYVKINAERICAYAAAAQRSGHGTGLQPERLLCTVSVNSSVRKRQKNRKGLAHESFN